MRSNTHKAWRIEVERKRIAGIYVEMSAVGERTGRISRNWVAGVPSVIELLRFRDSRLTQPFLPHPSLRFLKFLSPSTELSIRIRHVSRLPHRCSGWKNLIVTGAGCAEKRGRTNILPGLNIRSTRDLLDAGSSKKNRKIILCTTQKPLWPATVRPKRERRGGDVVEWFAYQTHVNVTFMARHSPRLRNKRDENNPRRPGDPARAPFFIPPPKEEPSTICPLILLISPVNSRIFPLSLPSRDYATPNYPGDCFQPFLNTSRQPVYPRSHNFIGKVVASRDIIKYYVVL